LNASTNAISYLYTTGIDRIRTWDEDILIRGANKLHGLLCKNCHVFVSCIARDIFICAVVQGDKNIQEN
jgi:hypothetical protein